MPRRTYQLDNSPDCQTAGKAIEALTKCANTLDELSRVIVGFHLGGALQDAPQSVRDVIDSIHHAVTEDIDDKIANTKPEYEFSGGRFGRAL